MIYQTHKTMNQQLIKTRRGRVRLTLLPLAAALLAGPAVAGNNGFAVPHTVARAVQQTITGQVTSAAGNTPLTGVSAAVKVKCRGSATDDGGMYAYSSQSGETLVFYTLVDN